MCVFVCMHHMCNIYKVVSNIIGWKIKIISMSWTVVLILVFICIIFSASLLSGQLQVSF